MSRISREEFFLETVLDLSKRSTCSRLHVGALITRDARILSMGYNGAPSGVEHCSHTPGDVGPPSCTRAVHAEANAVAWAARTGLSTNQGEMWITHQPCLSCAQLIINSGIVEVNFIHPYRDPTGLELLSLAGLHYRRWSYESHRWTT